MKLSPREAAGYLARPDPDKTGLLIYGADAMRVAMKRQDAIAALVGPQAEEEMRLARIDGASLRKDGAALLDAVKAIGVFPGPRVVFVEAQGDSATPAIVAALEEWRPGDAQIVVAAGALKPSSGLRKAFEAHPNAYAAAIYDDPPSRAEIDAELRRAGIDGVDRDAMDDIAALARALDPGDFRKTLEKIALYKHGDATPLNSADIDACAPASTEAAVDDILHVVAEGRARDIGPVMARLRDQGVAPVLV